MATSQRTASIPPIPATETERLEELHGLRLLDTASDLRFDRYTALVSEVFGFPIVLVSLVDRDRQWFKSASGLDLRETSRDISFCAHALGTNQVMVVPDALEDPRFQSNPLVTGPPHLRFYAGAVVHGPAGYPLGTLCVLDHVPRTFDDAQCNLLRKFADLVEQEIHHCHDLVQVRASVAFTTYADSLTRLPNRLLLIDRLGKLTELAHAEGRGVAVLVFNIKGLRMVNQSFGTQAGDDLLMEVADRISTTCPPGGTVARLLADEFAMAFPIPSGDERHIDEVADRVRRILAQPYNSDGREFYVGLRIGASIFPQHGTTPAALVDRAAAATRFGAEEPAGGVRVFSRAESVGVSEQLAMESRLRRTIDQGAFHLAYQPIVRLDDGSLAGVEALLRWTDAELGAVGPDRFIPVAESAGLVVEIGQWVQEAAFAQAAEWMRDGRNIPVAINVAAAELLRPDFAGTLLDRLAAHRVPPKMVRVEVTEFSLVSDSGLVDENMATLRDGGIQIIIDDFGTGYSSLAYLLRMPISSLKIDRSFVRGLPDSRNEVALTRTILGMARVLGLGSVGEGVETRQQLDFLRDAGCQYIQGYLVSQPVPAAEIQGFVGKDLFNR